MAWTAKPSVGSYSLDSGSIYKPTHLWMFDQGSGVSQSDIGVGTALDATLINADQWSSDGEVGSFIVCSKTGGSERYAYSATGTLGGTNFCGIVIAKSASSVATTNEWLFGQSLSTSVATGPFFGLRFAGDEQVYCIGFDNTNTIAAPSEIGSSYDQQWHMIAYKVQDNAIGISVDGAAWVTEAPTINFPFASGSGPNRYSFGAKVDSSPDLPFAGKITAAWSYEDGTYTDWDDTWISTLYNSQNPWSKFLTTSTPSMAPTMGRCVYILP